MNGRSLKNTLEISRAGHQCNQNEFEQRINAFEHEANGKCKSALSSRPNGEISNWFAHLLGNRIIPKLKQIGFTESFGWSIFQMAAPSWELMGPITDENLWLNPAFIKAIEEVKKGILSKSNQYYERLSFLIEMKPIKLHSLANKGMHPKNILSLLDHISTPWIILPRVYDHLKVHHSPYVLGYLKYLSNETNPEFQKIMTRIIIEFIGNYTLKFASKIHSKDRILDALFYGYAAMFWRNLKNPPSGFENMEIFEYFFRWAKRIQNKFAAENLEKANAIKKMEIEKLKAYPVRNAFGLARPCYEDMSTFLITLRHGQSGIEAVISSFGIGGILLKNMTDGFLPFPAVPTLLSNLFRKIKKNFAAETQRNQKLIRRFLSELKTSYDIRPTGCVVTENEFSVQLRFVRPRVLSMINGLIESIDKKRSLSSEYL